MTKDDDEFLFETREGGQLEEYYHSCSYFSILNQAIRAHLKPIVTLGCWVPVRDEKGEVGGLLNYTRNTTKKVSQFLC
jgi:hypothetical protein